MDAALITMIFVERIADILMRVGKSVVRMPQSWFREEATEVHALIGIRKIRSGWH